MIYVAEATALLLSLLAAAMAWMVCVEETVIGPAYFVDEVVGFVPSMV